MPAYTRFTDCSRLPRAGPVRSRAPALAHFLSDDRGAETGSRWGSSGALHAPHADHNRFTIDLKRLAARAVFGRRLDQRIGQRLGLDVGTVRLNRRADLLTRLIADGDAIADLEVGVFAQRLDAAHELARQPFADQIVSELRLQRREVTVSLGHGVALGGFLLHLDLL